MKRNRQMSDTPSPRADFPPPPEDCSEGMKLIWNVVSAEPAALLPGGKLYYLVGATDASDSLFSGRDRKAMQTLYTAAREAELYARVLAATLGGGDLAKLRTTAHPPDRMFPAGLNPHSHKFTLTEQQIAYEVAKRTYASQHDAARRAYDQRDIQSVLEQWGSE
jgi:hypothetical protein